MDRVKLGDTFNDWTVLEGAPSIRFKSALRYWPCRCVCGTEREVSQYDLTSGRSKGCSCRKRPSVSEETRALLSALAKDRPAPRPKGSFTHSEDTKKKISASMIKKHDDKGDQH